MGFNSGFKGLIQRLKG